ncbi:MAG: hypothetical protein OXI08_03465 [Cyanobacteria bacterium MAG IRC4_bin_6]|nr:hypothetical protein [Cyanobacteria bacterium MAG IRC3_bin_20]MDE0647110.1 hypothetical protein [Cyanobacteria bacterium MAG IRC4_bin_6]
MHLPAIYHLCQPRQDVLAGPIRDEDFAADLSQVLRGTAPELYKNPALFFANTHPTRGLKGFDPGGGRGERRPHERPADGRGHPGLPPLGERSLCNWRGGRVMGAFATATGWVRHPPEQKPCGNSWARGRC